MKTVWCVYVLDSAENMLIPQEIHLGALHCFIGPSLQLKGLETKGEGEMEVEQILFQTEQDNLLQARAPAGKIQDRYGRGISILSS